MVFIYYCLIGFFSVGGDKPVDEWKGGWEPVSPQGREEEEEEEDRTARCVFKEKKVSYLGATATAKKKQDGDG